MRVGDLNRLLAQGRRRADDLEQRMARLISPILNRAGDEAARRFEEHATDFLTAAAHDQRRSNDIYLLAAMDDGERRRVLSDLHLSASAPSPEAAMVAVKPRPQEAAMLAQEGGEAADTLHVTLCFLGDIAAEDVDAVVDALRLVAATHAPLDGEVGGIGTFGDGGEGSPSIALPDVPGLVELRVAVTEALLAADLDYSRLHGYLPHMTIAYDEGAPGAGMVGQPLHFDSIVVARGDVPVEIPLTGAPPITAAADSVARQVAQVAEGVAPEGGYGDTAWNPDTGVVRWVPADWSGDEDYAAAEEAFLAIEEVRKLEAADAESCLCADPDDGWTVVYGADCCDPPVNASALLADAQQNPTPTWGAPIPDQLIDVAALVAAIRARFDPVRRAFVEASMKAALDKIGVEWDATKPFVARVLAQAGSQIQGIAETTQLNVMRIIRESYEAGLSIPDTADAIRQGMRAATPARATLIARTELAGATNGGSLAAVQIVSEATGQTYYKRWVTADGAPHPRHEDYPDLDGQTVTLDGYFRVGDSELQHPGDPDGDPAEVCNCRCALVYAESLEGDG